MTRSEGPCWLRATALTLTPVTTPTARPGAAGSLGDFRSSRHPRSRTESGGQAHQSAPTPRPWWGWNSRSVNPEGPAPHHPPTICPPARALLWAGILSGPSTCGKRPCTGPSGAFESPHIKPTAGLEAGSSPFQNVLCTDPTELGPSQLLFKESGTQKREHTGPAGEVPHAHTASQTVLPPPG